MVMPQTKAKNCIFFDFVKNIENIFSEKWEPITLK